MLVLLTVSASGQKFLKKPWTEWSKEDALSILNDSPWAKTYSSNESGPESEPAVRGRRDTANRGTAARMPVVIRLHSSPYVRRAVVRMQQLGVKYDKMSAEEKAKFDDSRKVYLECAICTDYYVVTLTKFSAGETVDEGLFQSLDLDDMKKAVTLRTESDQVRELTQFTPPKGAGDAAIFFFKRTDDSGKLLVTPDTKELSFVFSSDFIQADKRYTGLYPRRFEFPVSKMIVDGAVAF